MVYDATTRCVTRRGQKFHENGYGQARYDEGALDDIFGDEVFVRYCECISGAVTVCDNAVMQWYIVVQGVAECGEVKSFTRMGVVKCVVRGVCVWVTYLVLRCL